MSTSAQSLAIGNAPRICQGVRPVNGHPYQACTTTLSGRAFACDSCAAEFERRLEDGDSKRIREAWQKSMLAAGFAPAFIEGRKTLATVRHLSTGHVKAVRAAEDLKDWTRSDGCRKSFLLRGGPGVGKSLIAEAAGAAFAEARGGENAAALFYNARQLGLDLQAASSPSSANSVDAILKRCQTARLLILDDVGATRSTRFQLDGIYSVLDYRCRHEAPVIITSNYESMANLAVRMVPDGGDLQDAQRVVDRIEELCPIVITLSGQSQRSVVNREQPEGRR